MISYLDHEGTNAGILVEHDDGRRGIIYHEDQKKKFPNPKNRVLVTMTDEDWEPRDVKKHIISEDKLHFKGYVN